MRAPYQILAIPYQRTPEPLFGVFHRADCGQYQFVAGGGEDDETPLDAAIREIKEEAGVTATSIIFLVSTAHIPVNAISEKHRKLWSKDTFVIPEYAFGFECDAAVHLSDEHIGFEWLNYYEAQSRLTWDSNKTALYELNCRLHTE